MSSPAGRRTTRSSQAGTPNTRNTRNSQARSSPAASGAAEAAATPAPATTGTPRGQRAPSSQLQSSPMLYESSPAADVNMGGASSPLRQMSDSQSTQGGALHDADHPMRGLAPSSPLAHETQSVSAGDRTPRASRMLGGKTTRVACEACVANRQKADDMRQKSTF